MEESFDEFEARMLRLMGNPTLAECDTIIKDAESVLTAALEVGLPEGCEPEMREAALEVVSTLGFAVVWFRRQRALIINGEIERMEGNL